MQLNRKLKSLEDRNESLKTENTTLRAKIDHTYLKERKTQEELFDLKKEKIFLLEKQALLEKDLFDSKSKLEALTLELH